MHLMNATPDRSAEHSWARRHFLVSTGLATALLLLIVWTTFVPVAPFTDEGIRLLSRGAVVFVVVLATAFARTVAGGNRKRHFLMAMGTVGGLVAGVASGALLSARIGTDLSSVSAICGVLLGWMVAYRFGRHLPRNGPSKPTPWHTW